MRKLGSIFKAIRGGSRRGRVRRVIIFLDYTQDIGSMAYVR
jgi:hypothetical protein